MKRILAALLTLYLLTGCSSTVHQTLRMGRHDTYAISGKMHASVGTMFHLEYDTLAFDRTRDLKYLHPKNMEKGMVGADAVNMTYTLSPKKKGKHVVQEVHSFRGKEQKRVKHVIRVKK